jgi:hypothetical protein
MKFEPFERRALARLLAPLSDKPVEPVPPKEETPKKERP